MVYLLIYRFKLTLAIRNQGISKIVKTHYGSKNLMIKEDVIDLSSTKR